MKGGPVCAIFSRLTAPGESIETVTLCMTGPANPVMQAAAEPFGVSTASGARFSVRRVNDCDDPRESPVDMLPPASLVGTHAERPRSRPDGHGFAPPSGFST